MTNELEVGALRFLLPGSFGFAEPRPQGNRDKSR